MWNVIGHDRIVELFQRYIASAALPHAILLTGPNGTGKTRLALELAKALNCVGEDPPCQTCLHCRQIETLSHPDVMLVERPEGKDSITIQQVRELREGASLRPFQGRFKVYIVAGAEALTHQAADALLKTLEEPQPQVVIVLTASEQDALPATIVSRCRPISLHRVPAAQLSAFLQKNGQAEAEAERLARLSGGSVGWALAAASQPRVVAQQEELVGQLSGLLDLGVEARLDLAESLTSDRKNRASVRRSLEVLACLGHDLLLTSTGQSAEYALGAHEETLRRQAERYSLSQLYGLLESIRAAMARIDQNVDPRLTLEAMFVNLP